MSVFADRKARSVRLGNRRPKGSGECAADAEKWVRVGHGASRLHQSVRHQALPHPNRGWAHSLQALNNAYAHSTTLPIRRLNLYNRSNCGFLHASSEKLFSEGVWSISELKQVSLREMGCFLFVRLQRVKLLSAGKLAPDFLTQLAIQWILCIRSIFVIFYPVCAQHDWSTPLAFCYLIVVKVQQQTYVLNCTKARFVSYTNLPIVNAETRFLNACVIF